MRRTALLLVAAVLGGCGTPPPPEVTPALVARAQVRWADADAAALGRGREQFLVHCGQCHEHPDPKRHDAKEWTYYVGEMAPKAQLDEAQHREVLRFLIAAHDVLSDQPR